MLRRNPESGVWERREGEAWIPAHNVSDMDVALDDAFEENAPDVHADRPTGEVPGGVGAARAAGPTTATDEARDTAPAGGPAAQAPSDADMVLVAQSGAADGPDAAGAGAVGDGAGAMDSSDGAHSVSGPSVEDADWDIPGLVSTETPRSVGGQRGLRKRLQDKLRGKRRAQPSGAGSAGAKKVEVGPRAAKPTGPAVKDSTESRQTRKRVRGAAMVDGKPQRYVSKPPPTLLESRPRWMQDLFEAHFRSESTLVMRRTHNRMKISRTDYAIGWLTLMDKLREDPSIARLKDGNGRA